MPETPTDNGDRTVKAVLLDAMGTLIALDPPGPRLAAALAAEGHHHDAGRVDAAMRAEIAHYRRHHLRGADAAGLAALHGECAAVLARELGGDVPAPERLRELLLDSLRYRALPDVAPALASLRSAGIAVAVVSDWDHSLPDVLHRVGLLAAVDVVVTSASVGAAKPDPAPFRAALDRLGVAPERALHCGDDPRRDLAGAAAAGVRALLIDRSAVRSGGATPVITTMEQVHAYVVGTRAPG